jgi:DivIVA domain-containing protein
MKHKLTIDLISEKIKIIAECGIEVKAMLAGRIKLTPKDILEKEFKVSIRGYNQDEVDQFLDIIIKDYETFQQEIEHLQQENARLKRQVEELQKRPSAQAGTTNYDILQRLSNLEKHVFGNKLYD